MKASSRRGVICTPHHLASEAGLAQLERGGTAIDAMLAASATLAAVYPHMTGLGGDAMWLLHDPAKAAGTGVGHGVRTLLGVGQAGRRLPDAGAISLRGPASVATTAGALASWKLAYAISTDEWGSSATWPDLLSDAASLAESGVAISPSQLFWRDFRMPLLGGLPDMRSLFMHADDRLLASGDRLRQPALATTLKHLARYGIDAFYEGDIATALSEHFARIGCGLDAEDLRRTAAQELAPVSIRYRNGRLFNIAPPSQGLFTLQALGAIAQLDLAALGNLSPAYYHALVEAIKPALRRRDEYLRAPEPGDQWPYADTLNEAALQRYASAIDPDNASPWLPSSEPADTVWMAASDEKGRSACLIQSLFHDFGSGCIMGDTGILWQNRAAGFNPDPLHPNAWAPGKRPAHTLNPSCYLADDGKRFFFGTQGGDGQPQTQMVLASQLIDFRQTPERAIAAPRFLIGQSFFDGNDNLKLEAAAGSACIQALEALGHQAESVPELNIFMGQAGIIAIDGAGRKTAVHDPRGHDSDELERHPISLGQRD